MSVDGRQLVASQHPLTKQPFFVTFLRQEGAAPWSQF